MKMIVAFAIAIAVSVAGCAPVQPVKPMPVTDSQNHVIDRNYTLGQEASAYVGQPLVKVKDYWVNRQQRGVMTASEAFVIRFPVFGPTVNVSASEPIELVGVQERDGKQYRVIKLSHPSVPFIGLLLNDNGTFSGEAINMMFNGAPIGYTVKPKPEGVILTSSTVENVTTDRGYVNFEIVYSGTSKDEVNLLYREFTPDDMARPAFTQNLTYSRGSNTIRFRDVLIRLIEANNEQIRYVVEQDGLTEG